MASNFLSNPATPGSVTKSAIGISGRRLFCGQEESGSGGVSEDIVLRIEPQSRAIRPKLTASAPEKNDSEGPVSDVR